MKEIKDIYNENHVGQVLAGPYDSTELNTFISGTNAALYNSLTYEEQGLLKLINSFIYHKQVMMYSKIHTYIDEISNNIINAIEKWVVEEFAPEVQNWIVEEYSPNIEKYLKEEYINEIKEKLHLVDNKDVDEIMNYINKDYSQILQKWLEEEFLPDIINKYGLKEKLKEVIHDNINMYR